MSARDLLASTLPSRGADGEAVREVLAARGLRYSDRVSYARPRTLPAEVRLPDGRVRSVRVARLGTRRALVEGLSGLVVRAGSSLLLVLEDVDGPLEIVARLDWIANRSGIRLLGPAPADRPRLDRIVAELELRLALAAQDDRELG